MTFNEEQFKKDLLDGWTEEQVIQMNMLTKETVKFKIDELLDELVKKVKKIEYCSRCCSPKKFCPEWGKYQSAVDTSEVLSIINSFR